MLITDITHRQTKEAIIKYQITDEQIMAFTDKQALRKYINKLSVKRCHETTKYHQIKYNDDTLTYKTHQLEQKKHTCTSYERHNEHYRRPL